MYIATCAYIDTGRLGQRNRTIRVQLGAVFWPHQGLFESTGLLAGVSIGLARFQGPRLRVGGVWR